MSKRQTPTTPELAADVLAVAVEKALKLERERSDRETVEAISTTRREADVDHRLDGHEARLTAINSSIYKTGQSLDSLKDSVDTFHDSQNKRNEKWDDEQARHWQKSGVALSKRQLYSGYAAVFAMLTATLVPVIERLLGA